MISYNYAPHGILFACGDLVWVSQPFDLCFFESLDRGETGGQQKIKTHHDPFRLLITVAEPRGQGRGMLLHVLELRSAVVCSSCSLA